MARKKVTNRRKKKETPFARRLRLIRGFLATVAIIILSSLGLWRCLDGNWPRKPSKRVAKVPVEKVDVGRGKSADPTLVNENQLLQQEADEKVPDVQKPTPEVDTDTVDTDTVDTEESEPTLEERFPNYGVAFHFHSQMKASPEHSARVIGYARRGSTFRLSEKISTKGCSRGWYEVSPGGLFVCNGAGVIVGNEPVSFAPSPVQPRLNRAMPYDYAYASKDNTPEYWRVPTVEEAKAVSALFDRLAVKENPEIGTDDSVQSTAVVPSTDTNSSPKAENADAGVEDPDALPPFVHMRMAKGYYVSIDDVVRDGKRAFQRTVRGRHIPLDRLIPAKPSDFEGFLVSANNPLPRAFVVGGGVSLLRQEKSGALVNHEKVGRLSMLDFMGEMTRRNRRYVQVGEGLYLSSRVAAVAEVTEPPKDLAQNERWIHIDLSEQTLVAYEGARPVFATLVSTGKPGFDTPTGTFRIYSKHVTVTMDDPDAGEEAYSIEDVPWVQYFKESFALHAAFWHNRFGRVRSHGCVNLSPKDAMRLFKWTGPAMPDGVHGVFATKENRGTRVVIQK